ncbi:unnamed protein product [Phytophthora lilii]|uniref:Unnamed protein product n=1 Tax=Phytophthora lilii TaxID=2077276 RepID=A0A9W6WWC7_9STRA|nr:unnamed protein product [Phytophthora lilii]
MIVSPSLVVPGVGPVEDTLLMIAHLCSGMKEARQTCMRLHTRLRVVFEEFKKKIGDHPINMLALGEKLVWCNTMMDELYQLDEEVSALYESLGINRATNWGDEWIEDLNFQCRALTTIVTDSELVIQALQGPRARAEAVLMLKHEVELRGERHDDNMLGLIKAMLTSIILASNTADERLPLWYIPLDEVEYESKPFGSGSVSTMHRGAWNDNAQIAVKIFKIDDEVVDDRTKPQLESELSALFALKHENIVSILGASHVSLPLCVVYKFEMNRSLGSFFARSEANKGQKWKLLYQTALGLAYIHKNNIVHGNLKLNNILVDNNGNARLADFGLTTMRTCSMLSYKQNETHRLGSGNLRWCAPDCLTQRPTIASDVYSFAMCMIEATISEPPFAFLSDDDVRDNVRKGVIPAKPDEMTEDMWELVISMTKFDPTKRRLQCSSGDENGNMAIVINEVTSNATIEPKHISALINRLGSATVQEQEKILQRLVDECIKDDQRAELYLSNGIAVLVKLVKSGGTIFSRLCALLCLDWVSHLDSKMSNHGFELLRTGILERALHEVASAKSLLKDLDTAKSVIYCAGISTVTKGEKLCDSELVSLLVGILRNGTGKMKLWSSVAVGKLANNDTNRILMANEGVIAPLLVLLQSETETQKVWATYALAKLCRDNETNSIAIANCGAIPLLMHFLEKGSDRQREFAALACGHLAFVNETSSEMIAHAGGILPLIDLLRGNKKQEERAGFALGGLMARSVENCTTISFHGGVNLLVALLLTGTDEQKESAAFALGTFVARGDVKNSAPDIEEAISYLVSLFDVGNDMQKELAALTLGTFSAGVSASFLHVALERAIVPLVKLLRSGEDGPREQAAFALGHLAGMNDTSRETIAHEGAIPVLISVLRDGSDLQKEHAVLGLGNLAMSSLVNGVEIVRRGAIPLLIALLRDRAKKHNVYAAIAIGNLAVSSNSNSVAIANEGAIPLLMALLQSEDDNLKEAGAFALARLAINEANGMFMVHDGAIPCLVQLMQCGNDRQKEQAAFALSELADKNYQNCELIAREGGIPPLVGLLGTGTDKQKEYAAMALSFICGEEDLDDHRVAISRAGAIYPLVSLVSNGSDPQKRWAALALGSLAIKDEANCSVIGREGAIPPLASLLRSALDRHKENAAFALGRLAAYSNDASLVSELESTVAPLVALSESGTDAQKEEAAFALGHIALKSDSSSETIVRCGGIPVLTSLLRSGTDKQKAYATMALVNLAANDRKILADVVREGIIGLLVQLERTGQLEIDELWQSYPVRCVFHGSPTGGICSRQKYF